MRGDCAAASLSAIAEGFDSPAPAPYLSPAMLLRLRPPGFIEPCLPSTAEHPPVGSNWVHEIKHDGFRLMARRDPAGVRLLTRNGRLAQVQEPERAGREARGRGGVGKGAVALSRDNSWHAQSI